MVYFIGMFDTLSRLLSKVNERSFITSYENNYIAAIKYVYLTFSQRLKYLLIFCHPSESLLVILSTGPGPPQCLGGPTRSTVSPCDNFNVFPTVIWLPRDKLDPPELDATVISAGSPGISESWASVDPVPRLDTTKSDPPPPHRNIASASFNTFIWK